MHQATPSWRAPALFWVGLAVAGALSLGVQLWLRSHPWLGWGAMGSDAEFWLARAGGLAASPLVGTHPPGYPLLVWLAGQSLGMARAGSLVSAVMGALLPVVGGILGWRAAGWRRGLLAAASTFLLPCLQFSALRAEATTTYGVGVGLVLLAALALDRRRGVGAALALGLALGALTLVKEQALVLLPGMALVPLLGERRRPGLSALVVLAWAVGVAPVAVASALADGPSILGKVTLPLVDMLAWFTDHQIPGPLYQHYEHEPALDPGLAAGGSLRIFWAIALRNAEFAGPWTLLGPISAGLLLADRDGKRVEPGARRVVLLGATAVLALLLVPVLARHVELALLPLVWGLPLVVPVPGGWARRGACAVGLVALVVGSWQRESAAELATLRASAAAVAERTAQAEQVVAALGPHTHLCSHQGWMAAFSGRPVDCSPELPPGSVGVAHLERHVVQRCGEWLLEDAEDVSASDVVIRTESPERWRTLVGLDCGAAARERERSQRLGGQTGR